MKLGRKYKLIWWSSICVGVLLTVCMAISFSREMEFTTQISHTDLASIQFINGTCCFSLSHSTRGTNGQYLAWVYTGFGTTWQEQIRLAVLGFGYYRQTFDTSEQMGVTVPIWLLLAIIASVLGAIYAKSKGAERRGFPVGEVGAGRRQEQ